MNESLHKQINQTIHQPLRLSLMTFLQIAKTATFAVLKKNLTVTDGNLGAHLEKLEKEGLIEIEKKFVNKKPSSNVSITEKGEIELGKYIEVLKKMVN